MTIDLEELYLAVLKRNCQIKVSSVIKKRKDTIYLIEIAEDNGVVYTVSLHSDHDWDHSRTQWLELEKQQGYNIREVF